MLDRLCLYSGSIDDLRPMIVLLVGRVWSCFPTRAWSSPSGVTNCNIVNARRRSFQRGLGAGFTLPRFPQSECCPESAMRAACPFPSLGPAFGSFVLLDFPGESSPGSSPGAAYRAGLIVPGVVDPPSALGAQPLGYSLQGSCLVFFRVIPPVLLEMDGAPGPVPHGSLLAVKACLCILLYSLGGQPAVFCRIFVCFQVLGAPAPSLLHRLGAVGAGPPGFLQPAPLSCVDSGCFGVPGKWTPLGFAVSPHRGQSPSCRLASLRAFDTSMFSS